MPDPLTLTGLLVAGGTVVAQATVEEATKDAWQGMKSVLRDLFGRRASDSVERLESDSSRDAGRIELDGFLATVSDEEATTIAPAAERLASALKEDPGADAVLNRNSINLDLDARGDVLLQRIRGANAMNVRSRSDGDFTLSDVSMGSDPTSGN